MYDNSFKEKDCLVYKKHEALSFEEYLKQIPQDFKGLIFKTIDRDAIGRSGGNPRWGRVFEYEDNKISETDRIAIYKEPDYDEIYGPCSEKLWSILGKLVLPDCKVPDIDIIKDRRYSNIQGVMSYSVVDKEKEDMTDIRTILRYNHLTEQEMRANNDRLYLEQLLEYVKNFINNEEKFKPVEKQIIQTIMLDCITNSFDRHPDNWALICDNQTGEYKLGLYDNTVSFINIINSRPGVVNNDNWGSIFLKVKDERNKDTDMADKVIKYISKQYPEYYNNFVENLCNNLDKFYELIQPEEIGQMRFKEIMKNLNRRKSYLKKLNIEEREY